MHPSQAILCQKSEKLRKKTVVLGITGSIAATECVKLARELIRHGANVVPVMSEWAQKIIHPISMEFATGHEPITEIDGSVQYVDLCGENGIADLLLIAPATANTISKIAHGITDSTVSIFGVTSLGSKIPIVIVPAMHISLYDQPVIDENMRKLEKLGVEFIRPRITEHKAKMASTNQIVSSVIQALGPGDMEGKKVTVIAGSTEEPIDDVRVLTNRSSGRTGIELAIDAYERGGEVELLMGRTECELPGHIRVKRFSSSSELVDLARKIKSDICIVPAAISDYIPKKTKGKISSAKKSMTLDLIRAPKIIEEIRRNRKKMTLIAFKLESNVPKKTLISRAKERMSTVGLDYIVANDIELVKPDSNQVIIIDKKGKKKEIKGSKSDIAHEIWSAVLNGI